MGGGLGARVSRAGQAGFGGSNGVIYTTRERLLQDAAVVTRYESVRAGWFTGGHASDGNVQNARPETRG